MKTEEQVAVIFAGANGYLDKVAVRDVQKFEAGLLSNLRSKHADLLKTIAKEKKPFQMI